MGITKAQIISISNFKELKTMRKRSEWVKDKYQGVLRTLRTHRCRMRAWESSELAKWTAENPCPSCAWEPVDRDPCMSCLESVVLGTGILVSSTTLISLGCLCLCKVSSPLLILGSASFLLLLCLVFQLSPQSCESESQNALIAGLATVHTRRSILYQCPEASFRALCWEVSVGPHVLPGKCSPIELHALPIK